MKLLGVREYLTAIIPNCNLYITEMELWNSS